MLQKLNKLLAIIPRQQFLRYNKRDFINLIISCYEQILEYGNIMTTFITEVNEGKHNGKSAYEIAVQQGYVGTETEWLKSLKGADGVVTEEQLQKVETTVFNNVKPIIDKKQDKFKYLSETESWGVDITYWGSEISSYLNVNEYGSTLSASYTGSGESKNIGSIGVTENGVEVKTYGNYKFTCNGKEIVIDPSKYYTKTEVNNNFTSYREFDNTINYLSSNKQNTLVSGTNIKTINGDSILGSGNIAISGGEGKVKDVKVDSISVLDTDGIANIELAPINNRVKAVEDKVDNLELFKFPNATIFGQPTIRQGQISNFTAKNYLQFPFIVDFQNRPWQIDMAVTMGADVSGQHNILDSNFGLAFAIQNTKLVLALSYDGVAWAGTYTSSTSISPNKTYYIKISWDGAIYKVDVSENKTTYTNFISVNSTNTLYPRTITIGKSLDNRYIWNGSINFNEAKLTISDKVVWTGMDDAGLSTRLAVNLNNIDSEGKKAINDIVNIGEFGQKVEAISEQVAVNTAKVTELDLKTEDISTNNVGIEEDGIDIYSEDDILLTNISVGTSFGNDEVQKWCSDDGTEEYVEIGNYGIRAKNFFNLDGTPIISDSPLRGKKVLFFGDSLVAASTPQNTNKGFTKLIAEKNGIEWKRYYNDNEPIEKDFVGIRNIAKDGTTLRNSSLSSIYNRVINWCIKDYCDLAVIQGGTNDFNTAIGVITSGYNDTLDTNTTIGALEAILKHCTNNGIKVCFIIMHKVNYIADNYYDFAKDVCKKWGVPYLDLTHSAGFYMSGNNPNHGNKYSILSSENWDSQKTYNRDDKVAYDGKSYKCNLDNVKGVLPTDTLYWTKTSDYIHDFCHLNDLGHEIIANKIENFIKSI